MWFHGGGWVLGNVVDYDPICTFIAADVGCVVVSVDYRMAPEHRAPVAVEDCVDATTWVGVNGDVLRADTSRMAVAGDSAGGNLAAVVAQVLRDHGDTRLRHQALIYPATDLTMSSPSVREHHNARDPHQAVDGRLPRPLRAGRPRPARPAALPAVRAARRPAAGPGADRRPRPDPRRRHPLRRRAAGCRGAGAAHQLPQGAPRLRLHAGGGPRGGAAAAVGAGHRAAGRHWQRPADG